jgi:hypothetical protein
VMPKLKSISKTKDYDYEEDVNEDSLLK